jgi:hypothetical protein
MADACSEHTAEHAYLPREPDTCVLFRPAAPSAAFIEGRWVPGNHDSEAVGACIKSLTVLHDNPVKSPAARQAGIGQSTAQQPARLFSPSDAIRGFSKTALGAQQEPAQAPAPSTSAITQRPQRYSAVHGLTKQQNFQAYPPNTQDGAMGPELARAHQAQEDPGHWIQLSTQFLDGHTAADLEKRPGQVSACR